MVVALILLGLVILVFACLLALLRHFSTGDQMGPGVHSAHGCGLPHSRRQVEPH